jgi:hypothetical protein
MRRAGLRRSRLAERKLQISSMTKQNITVHRTASHAYKTKHLESELCNRLDVNAKRAPTLHKSLKSTGIFAAEAPVTLTYHQASQLLVGDEDGMARALARMESAR